MGLRKLIPMERNPGLEAALSRRRAITEIAEALGVSRAAVSQWRQVPLRHLEAVAKLTGISKRKLRPDLYPPRCTRQAAE